MTNIELEAARAQTRIPHVLEEIERRLADLYVKVDLLARTESSDIDWEERRYELAKAAITGIAHIDHEPKFVAVAAVRFADAVIDELKRTR